MQRFRTIKFNLSLTAFLDLLYSRLECSLLVLFFFLTLGLLHRSLLEVHKPYLLHLKLFLDRLVCLVEHVI